MGRRPYTPEQKAVKLEERRARRQKQCGRCHRDKPIGEFYGKGDNNYCRGCNRLAVLTGSYQRMIRDKGIVAASALLESLVERAGILANLIKQTGDADMQQDKLNDRERRLWVLNDESLYNWQRSSRLSMAAFIKENREELDRLILARLNGPPR